MNTKVEERTTSRAQHVVCGYLVRACQYAIYELAVDESRDPDLRRESISMLRVILEDWREARRALREELRASPRGDLTNR